MADEKRYAAIKPLVPTYSLMRYGFPFDKVHSALHGGNPPARIDSWALVTWDEGINGAKRDSNDVRSGGA